MSKWGGEAIHDAVVQASHVLQPPNRAVKFEVNLATARTEKSLIEEGLIPSGKTFLYLTVLKVGTGVWSFKQKFEDGSTIEYGSDELRDGYLMERRFVDILFTNASQSGVANPKLLIEWVE